MPAASSPQKLSECIVVSGLSGAGKSSALRALEDMGYFCVDNLPLSLLPSLVKLYHTWGHRLTRVAVGVDVRTGLPGKVFEKSLSDLRRDGIRPRVLFMDADDTTLLRRFSETRRRHPLSGSVIKGIARERKFLRDVKSRADKVIDSSHLTPPEVKEIVLNTLGLQHPKGLAVLVMSFGYKQGVPLDADLVLDVRFLPNPNYVNRLRPLTGQNPAVSRFVMGNPATKKFMALLTPLMEFLLSGFEQEGKSYLTVAIGCTGGRHRSVAIAEALGQFIRQKKKFEIRVFHRDASR